MTTSTGARTSWSVAPALDTTVAAFMTAARAAVTPRSPPMWVPANLQLRRDHRLIVGQQQCDWSMPEPVHINDPAPTTIAMTSAMVSTMAERRRAATIRARVTPAAAPAMPAGAPQVPTQAASARCRERHHPQIGEASPNEACIGKLPIPPALKEEPVNHRSARLPQACCVRALTPGRAARSGRTSWAPIPSTSCSSSIRLNRPCCCRHVRMAPAVTGPIPGSPRAAPGWRGSDRVSPSLRPLPCAGRASISHFPRRIASGTDHHLLAVGKRLCQVQLTRVGSPCEPTCCIDRILDASSRELDQPRVTDGTEHMDDEPGRPLTGRS